MTEQPLTVADLIRLIDTAPEFAYFVKMACGCCELTRHATRVGESFWCPDHKVGKAVVAVDALPVVDVVEIPA